MALYIHYSQPSLSANLWRDNTDSEQPCALQQSVCLPPSEENFSLLSKPRRITLVLIQRAARVLSVEVERKILLRCNEYYVYWNQVKVLRIWLNFIALKVKVFP